MEKNKVNQVNQAYTSTKEPVVSLGEVKNTYREKEGLSINYIMEHRRRIQTPSFAKGSVSEAKDWLAEYKSVCQHLQYSEQEKLDELEVRLKGMALTWYSYLLPESKKTWNQFEQAFRDYFAGGTNTVEAAMNELKQLRQGNKKMMVFGQELWEEARRAEIYSDRMLIGYLKAAVNPEMTRAIIYRGPSSYAEAVNICIEVETDLLRNLAEKTSYNPPYTIAPVSTNTEVPTQNFQRKEAYGNKKTSVRCFRCKKLGHMKKDCRVTRDFGTKYGKKVNAQDTGKNNRGAENKIYEDTDINIFSQFFQANNNAEKGGDSTESPRFKVEIDTEKGSQLALVDTGSTICSIVEETVQQLGLEVYVCAPEVIRYGNSSTQVTTSKAILKFGFNNGERSTAHLYLVKEQNEPIILGMDWLVKENIILHPGSKTLSKTKLQDINSMEKVEEILQKYPELTEESKYQTLTKAPYKHRIDTGDALPNVTRDYRRSEVENQAIQKEVEGMLARRVIVPSSSDWCSPVVLIKKPDGSFRFCVDYRGVNKLTVKDKYPLPRITELLDKLNGSQYFSTIDLKSGYWQLPIDPRDAKKTAFIANGSLYEFNCLPFGVVNGPSSFMRFMHIVLKGLTQAMF
ncbi:hypothetical protein G6F43_012771 [Rhizopus delemar]|nr:hypothetical protein G6F43_012771 [Rhizopus delemar]